MSKYGLKDFSYKLDNSGFQIIFKGEVLQTTKVDWNDEMQPEKLRLAMRQSTVRLIESTPDDILDWQLHWKEMRRQNEIWHGCTRSSR
jgi:hypothetical protein